MFVNRKVSFRVQGVFTLDTEGNDFPLDATRARMPLPDGRSWEIAFAGRTSNYMGTFTGDDKMF